MAASASSKKRKKSLSSNLPYLDCTAKCQLFDHARVIIKIAALGNVDLLRHSVYLCGNPWNVSDERGLTALHVVSSLGHLQAVDWLLKKKSKLTIINSPDHESKWTSLHRAAYYGHPHVMISLIKGGANVTLLDNDGCSPLNLLQLNFNLADTCPAVSEVILYMWGTNINMTLGHHHCRSTPEISEALPPLINISQVVLCKFHTLLLSERGEVYSCGHGPGGRLGHGNENTALSPKLIEELKGEVCVGIAAARNHSVFLTQSGSVYTCGINDACQLGHNMKTGLTLPTPSVIKMKSKLEPVVHVGAGRYHTALSTETQVFSFGKNLGQLGYERTSSLQPNLKLVTAITVDSGDSISHLSVSDAATACITTRRHQIFICINYNVVRCERYSFPESFSVKQFVVCASLGDLEHKKDSSSSSSGVIAQDIPSGNAAMIGLLDSQHQLWFSQWTNSKKKASMSPQIISGTSKFSIAHFSLTKNLSIVTNQGEVYTGPVASSCPSLLSLERVPMVQQAKKVFTDFKATNMAVLQNIYSPLEQPQIETSNFSEEIFNLLSETNLASPVADVHIKVAGSSYTANSLVLSSSSCVFSSLFSSKQLVTSNLIQSFAISDQQWHVALNYDSSDIFHLFLTYLYGGKIVIQPHNHIESPLKNDLQQANLNASKSSIDTSDTSTTTVTDWNVLYDQFGVDKNQFDQFDQLPVEELQSLPKLDNFTGKTNVPVRVHRSLSWLQDINKLLELAAGFEVAPLIKGLEEIISSRCKPFSCSLSHQVTLDQTAAPHDVVLISEEGQEIHCHKCLLVSRSDYFQSMLLMGWKESMSEDSVTILKLPISYKLLEVVVDYLYRDVLIKIPDSVDFLCSALAVADQFLLSRLKSICERKLTKFLNIRNISEMTEFSSLYNATQLERTCFQFICNNLLALIECGVLESLPSTTLDQLSQVYKEMYSFTNKRTFDIQEPQEHELPMSYFNNEVILSDDNDDITDDIITTTPLRSKSPSSSQGSSSRRKKKKKQQHVIRDDASKSHVTSTTPPTSPNSLPLVIDDPITTTPPAAVKVDEIKQTKFDELIVSVDDSNHVTPWVGGKPRSSSQSSLKQIMEEEQLKLKVEWKEKTKKNKKKTQSKDIINNHSNPHKSSDMNVGSLPNDILTNPWGTLPPSTTPMSFRDLMEAEENKEKRRLSLPPKLPPIQRSYSCDESQKIASEPKISPVISFADIVNDQQREMEQFMMQSRHKKPLQLIQIEEAAIEQLMELYNASGNPDEYITIKRVSSQFNNHSTVKSPSHVVTSTAAAASVWANKIQF